MSEQTTKHPHLRIFARLLGFLGPYKWSLAVSIVLAAASQAAALALIRVTQSVIDDGIRPGEQETVWVLIGVIVALGLVKALLMVGRRFISGRQALGVEFDMRNALYGHLLRLSFGFYDRHQTGQLMSRATVDLQGVRFFLGYGLIFFAQNLFTIVGATAIMFWTDWQLALVAVAITPALIVLAYRYSRVSHPVLRDVQQKIADVTTVAEENIVGVHVVKSFAQEELEAEKFRLRSEAVFERTIDANRQRSLYVPLLSFIPLLAQAAILLLGGWMVVHDQLTVGEFFAFNLYVSLLIMPLRMLGMWIGQSQRATASGERIFQILDEPEEIADGPGAIELPPGEGRIAFEGVSFGYDPERPVLDGLEFDVEPGRSVAVIGHTGSGKTTLTALVPRFYDVTAGRVLVDGTDVRDVTLTSLRRSIAVISQDPFLFSTTVRENVAFGAPDATDEEIERAARLAQAHEFIAALPEGYDTVIGERGITLSGGQRQRSSRTRASSSSTTRRPLSTRPRRRGSAQGCVRQWRAGRRSSSPTGSRPSRSRTRSSCSTTGASSRAGRRESWRRRARSTGRSTSTG
jgi:ABC-type multidrug transport system fused ATPase/permease subunit